MVGAGSTGSRPRHAAQCRLSSPVSGLGASRVSQPRPRRCARGHPGTRPHAHGCPVHPRASQGNQAVPCLGGGVRQGRDALHDRPMDLLFQHCQNRWVIFAGWTAWQGRSNVIPLFYITFIFYLRLMFWFFLSNIHIIKKTNKEKQVINWNEKLELHIFTVT